MNANAEKSVRTVTRSPQILMIHSRIRISKIDTLVSTIRLRKSCSNGLQNFLGLHHRRINQSPPSMLAMSMRRLKRKIFEITFINLERFVRSTLYANRIVHSFSIQAVRRPNLRWRNRFRSWYWKIFALPSDGANHRANEKMMKRKSVAREPRFKKWPVFRDYQWALRIISV